jgi:cyclopropane fatty-acyl-phospholipid synthase-like methyltransferase
MELPFSEAAERNKEPILKVLKEVIRAKDQHLLEIGAGTGQHAVFFAPHFPQVEWNPTETAEPLPLLNRRIQESRIQNLMAPRKLTIGVDSIPNRTYDVVFTANTFHIMSWKECKTLIKELSGALQEGGRVVIYGPFNYNGGYTSESNAEFDKWVKENFPGGGLRSFEDVLNAMTKNGFELVRDFEMPANNRTLVFRRLKYVSKK